MVLAFLKRDFSQEISYKVSFTLRYCGVFFSVMLFYYVAKTFGSAASPYLEPYGGDYFSFVIVGIAFSSYLGSGISGLSSSIRAEQMMGTLESVLVTPTSLGTIVVASSLWQFLNSSVQVVVYLLVGALFFGLDVSQANVPATLLTLALTVITFTAIGVLSACFIVVFKRGDPVGWIFSGFSQLFGGVLFPIAVLPGWLRVFSVILPLTYALKAMRMALLQGASITTLAPDLAILAGFAVVMLALGILAFRYAVTIARREGTLAQY